MKRERLCIAFLLLTLVSCGQINRQMKYVKDAKTAVGDAEWLNFDVAYMWDSVGGVTTPYCFSVISHLDDKDPYYVVAENKKTKFGS